jgi:hypothetical protein
MSDDDLISTPEGVRRAAMAIINELLNHTLQPREAESRRRMLESWADQYAAQADPALEAARNAIWACRRTIAAQQRLRQGKSHPAVTRRPRRRPPAGE